MEGLMFLESAVKMPLLTLPVRSVLVKHSEGQILLSPGSKLDRETLLSQKGVTDIIATNLFHHAGVPKAAAIFPNAHLWAVEGLKEKRSDIPWTREIGKNPWPYQQELPVFKLEGMPTFNEVVFLHRKSRSLIVTDLCFNLLEEKGFGPWLFFKIFGTYRRFAVSRLFANTIKDKTAFRKSMELILQEDFDNIILSHGRNLIGGAKEKLKQALAERGL